MHVGPQLLTGHFTGQLHFGGNGDEEGNLEEMPLGAQHPWLFRSKKKAVQSKKHMVITFCNKNKHQKEIDQRENLGQKQES